MLKHGKPSYKTGESKRKGYGRRSWASRFRNPREIALDNVMTGRCAFFQCKECLASRTGNHDSGIGAELSRFSAPYSRFLLKNPGFSSLRMIQMAAISFAMGALSSIEVSGVRDD